MIQQLRKKHQESAQSNEAVRELIRKDFLAMHYGSILQQAEKSPFEGIEAPRKWWQLH
jgi:hypothetical protein